MVYLSKKIIAMHICRWMIECDNCYLWSFICYSQPTLNVQILGIIFEVCVNKVGVIRSTVS